jgi:tetratricopeptide (TPR) repeat protein
VKQVTDELTNREPATLERIDHLRAVAAAHAEDPRTWAKLAPALWAEEGPDRAIADVTAAYGRHPSPGLKRVLSDQLRKARRFDEAIELWAGATDPASALVRADILLEDRRYEAAESAYASVLEAGSDSAAALAGLARVSQRTRDWRDALTRWRGVAKLMPGDPRPLTHIAGVQRITGEIAKAERTIQQAIALTAKVQPVKFWGPPGEPHPDALQMTAAKRVKQALSDLEQYLVTDGSPYHPSTPAPFDGVLADARDGRSSGVLQYPSEAKFLALFLAERGVRSFFEVGMRHGGFAQLLDAMLEFERVGGSELIVTPRLRLVLEDDRYDVFVGDHHSDGYRRWREAREPFDFVFIDGGHTYNEVLRDFQRERAFKPRFIGFHDVWNTSCLGAKRMWDDVPGKLLYYCNVDPDEYFLVQYRNRNFDTSFFDRQREANGYCAGIGIVEVDG